MMPFGMCGGLHWISIAVEFKEFTITSCGSSAGAEEYYKLTTINHVCKNAAHYPLHIIQTKF